MRPCLRRGLHGYTEPSFLFTHKIGLEDGLKAYKTFQQEKGACIKAVINLHSRACDEEEARGSACDVGAIVGLGGLSLNVSQP